MTFDELLRKKRDAIRGAWIERIVEEYPAESVRFIRTQKDRFRNPIGETIEKGTEAVLDGLIDGADRETLKRAADGIIRLRAVQDFPPSQAVGFLLRLKGVIEKVVGDHADPDAHEVLDTRIDDLVLDSFDLYMQCREKVFEIRVNETRARTWKLLERAEEAEVQRGADQ
jgi:hypothetical protein